MGLGRQVRPYPGISPESEEDATRRDKFRRLDWYLRDLDRGLSSITKGLVPDGSGSPIIDNALSDIYLVLKGRPGNQVAHGGTMSGGKLTLSSTNHPTKGKVYLGEAELSAYDETNERLGIQTASPAARLHLKHTSDAAPQTFLPVTDTYNGGGWGLAGGGGDYCRALQTNDGTTSFVQGPSTGSPRSGPTIALQRPPTVTTNSGWSLHFVARKAGGSGLCLEVSCQLSIAFFTGGAGWDGTGGHGGTFGGFDTNSGGAIDEVIFNGPFATLGDLTTSYVEYTRNLTSGEMAALVGLLNTSPGASLIVLISTKGNNSAGGEVPEFSQVFLQGPALPETTPLQKWENPTYSNTLNYALDTAGATTLELTGTPKFRIGSASNLEIASGSPASGMVGVATDTDGTHSWASASSIATRIEHRFVANGFYVTDTNVDVAWVPRRSMTLSKVLLYRRAGGSAGSTTVDLMKNGTSVLSSAPSIAFNAGASATASGTISTTAIASGDIFTVNCTADSGRPQDWMFEIEAY